VAGLAATPNARDFDGYASRGIARIVWLMIR
jgi:hypothetical protein